MLTVHEVSELTGVSARALHHYDAIGLLRPTEVTEAGYRLYDDEALRRLRSIMLFRELEFPLREIARILDSPDCDPNDVLLRQIEMLELRRERLGRIIDLARDIQKNGVNEMSFSAFDRTGLDAYADEAREKWGGTDAYRQYERKAAHTSKEQQRAATDRMMGIFADLGKMRGLPPESPEVQTQISALRDHITENYYDCTPEILRSLGEMYVSDERMKQNIDKAGGEGTAELAAAAIELFCRS